MYTDELIASEDVTDVDRDDKRRWHLRLPEPNPRATRTVLTYKEYVKEKSTEAPAPVADASEMPPGCEYNRNGELCRRDARGFLYPLDENGERRRYKHIKRPREVEPYIWYDLTYPEKERMAEEYKATAASPTPSSPSPVPRQPPLVCAPLGWDNILVTGVSGHDQAQVKHTPVVAANIDIDHVSLDGHAMVDRPPWEQFDLDANDYLVDSNPKYWNTVEGPCYKDFPTAGAVPSTTPSSDQSESKCKPVRGNQGDVIPAMPLLVDEEWNQVYPTGWGDRPTDPYGLVCPTEITFHASWKDIARRSIAEPADARSTR